MGVESGEEHSSISEQNTSENAEIIAKKEEKQDSKQEIISKSHKEEKYMNLKIPSSITGLLKDNNKLAFLGVLIIAAIIRLYYYFQTLGQAVWWDEGEYLLHAKHIAFGLPDTGWFAAREPLMTYIWAFFFKIGADEPLLRILQLGLSVLAVALVYFVGKKVFDERIALLGAFFFAIFNHHLFFTYRLLLSVPMVIVWLSAIYLFLLSEESDNKWLLIGFAAISAIGVLIYYSAAFLMIAVAIYLLAIKRAKVFTEMKTWYSLIAAGLIIAPFLIYNQLNSGAAIPRLAAISKTISGTSTTNFLDWFAYLKFISELSHPIILLFFVLGLLFLVFNLIVGYDQLKSNKKIQHALFILLWLIAPIIVFGYIAYTTGHSEPRYIIPLFPAVFFLAASGVFFVYDKLAKYKVVAVAFLIIIMAAGAYTQLQYADNLIMSRTDSFSHLKTAGLWLKDNAPADAVIFNAGVPQNTHYSERYTDGYPQTAEEFEEKAKDLGATHMVISMWQPSPEWTYTYAQDNLEKVKPVQVYYADEQQQQAALVIYELNL